ncbi:MAG TPA: ABC transporter permease [Bryobacteraceae bacterium]|jgi:predicted permease|nr:ABC transporter permease [Bryobacteraceae bacterium]
MGRTWNKIIHLLRRRRFEADLQEELLLHRQMLEEHQGHPRDFGNATLALENSREQWSFRWIESLRLDLRYAIRGFFRAPLFALTVIGTIGLALGLNTTLFTVFNAYVLRPVAVHDPAGLYEFRWVMRQNGRGRLSTWAEYEKLRDSGIGFSEVAAYTNLGARLNGYSMLGHLVTGNYFSMLGVDAAMGRVILPADLAGDAESAVIVLSHSAWSNKLGADPNILGSKLVIHGQPLQVVGVTRPEFGGIDQVTPDFWIPLTMSPRITPQEDVFAATTGQSLWNVGRLRPGLSVAAARAQLAVWAVRTTADRAESQRANGAQLVSRATMLPFNREVMRVFIPVLAAFVLVLLIACANVANMMLARGLARQREIGIRLSLGAARGRLIRQLLTESLLLAIPAALAGLAISAFTIRLGQDLIFATLPPEFLKIMQLTDLTPDWRVFGFILLGALLSTFAFGLAPAFQATRRGLVQASRGDFSADLRPGRLRNALVISQVTVCALLLIVAGVLLRGGRQIAARDPRMVTSGVVDIRMASQFQAKAAETLRALPWVESVAAVWRAPYYGGNWVLPVVPSGSRDQVLAAYNFVGPDYFAIFRIALLRGRNFTLEEARAEAAVVIVSESTAQHLWPGRDPLAQSIEVQSPAARYGRVPRQRTSRVIGVARDVISGWVGDGLDHTMLYFPATEASSGIGSIVVRLRGDPETLRRVTEEALNRAVPGAADQINPMDQVLAIQIYPFRVAFWVSSFLGGLALALTISGIYGVMAYLVGQRSKEIGIRMAMGASAVRILRLVLGQTLRLTLVGLAIGVAAALGVSRLFASQLEMVNLFDQLAYAGGIALVFAAALIASLVPSRRAVKVDPVTALRCD